MLVCLCLFAPKAAGVRRAPGIPLLGAGPSVSPSAGRGFHGQQHGRASLPRDQRCLSFRLPFFGDLSYRPHHYNSLQETAETRPQGIHITPRTAPTAGAISQMTATRLSSSQGADFGVGDSGGAGHNLRELERLFLPAAPRTRPPHTPRGWPPNGGTGPAVHFRSASRRWLIYRWRPTKKKIAEAARGDSRRNYWWALPEKTYGQWKGGPPPPKRRAKPGAMMRHRNARCFTRGPLQEWLHLFR